MFAQKGLKAYSWENVAGSPGGLYINHPGNIGIGIAKPTSALHIHREINFDTDPYAVIRLSINDIKAETHVWDIGNFDNLHFKFSTDDNTITKMMLTPLGQLALGTETPTLSAILQLESTDKGLLMPRMTTAEKNSIASPVNGLLVYDTDLQTFSFYDDGTWKEITINSTLNDYLTISDFNNSPAGSITNTDKANWNTAYSWGDHSTVGYLTSYTETDPVYASKFDLTSAASGDLLQYNGTKFVKFTPNYLTSYTETDPIFTTWDKDYDDLTNKPTLFDGQWNSLSGTPPNISTFANDINYITDGNTNWNNEYGFITNADIATYWNRTGSNTTLANRHDNVGIGTNSPQKAIHIFREKDPYAVSTSSSLRLENLQTGSEEWRYAWDFENSNNDLCLKFGDAPRNIEVLTTETKFTFSKKGKLTAKSFKNDNFSVSENGTITATRIIADGFDSQSFSSSPWVINGDNISYNVGNVGIGTSNPNEKLDVNGTIQLNDIKIRRSTSSYDYFRLINNSNTAFAGFMYNKTEGYYGKPNDFTIYTYEGRNINLKTGGNIILGSNNVGIGTTNPYKTLDVVGIGSFGDAGGIGALGIEVGQILSSVPSSQVRAIIGIANSSIGVRGDIIIQPRSNETTSTRFFIAGNEKMRIHSNGNVGIGTKSPTEKLTLTDGAILLNGNMPNWTNSGWKPRIQSPLGTVWASTTKVNTGGNYYLGLGMTNSGWYFMTRKDDKTKRYVCVISDEGNIYSTSVKVKQMNWSDFVFNKKFELTPLNELENYINKNQHLPNMPTQKEIAKDGLDLGNMQKLQMQKIEELTLYILQLNKRIEKLEKENSKLKN